VNGLIASGPRYALVGAVFAVLNALMLIVFDWFGLHYTVALGASMLTLVPLSYLVHLRFTYGVAGGLDSFWRYCGAQMISMPLSLVMLFFVHDLAGIPMKWAAWIVLGLMFLYNFLSSYWAIRSRANIEGSPS
jgi:putative flippase GtrA